MRAPTSPPSGPARELRDGEWHLNGQKVWTSLAHVADWCFVLARTDSEGRASPRPVLPAGADAPAGRGDPADRGSSPERRSSTRCSSTTRAPTPAPSSARRATAGGSRWARSASSAASPPSASRSGFQREFESVLAAARANGTIGDPEIAARIADAWIGLQVLRSTSSPMRPTLVTRVPARSGCRAGNRGQHRQAAVGALASAARRAGGGRGGRQRHPDRPRATTCRRRSGSSCTPAPTRSTAAPTRSSATSSPSGGSAFLADRQRMYETDTPEQAALRETVRDFCRKHAGHHAVSTWARGLAAAHRRAWPDRPGHRRALWRHGRHHGRGRGRGGGTWPGPAAGAVPVHGAGRRGAHRRRPPAAAGLFLPGIAAGR